MAAISSQLAAMNKENQMTESAAFATGINSVEVEGTVKHRFKRSPSYAKFINEILSKKKKFAEFENVALTEECSANIQKKLPHNLKDPSSFTISCAIGVQFVGSALCDFGVSVNLMPISVYNKLGLTEMKPTRVISELADRSVKYPCVLVEDVLVKVDKLILPTDFFVLDIEDYHVPINLGRPFLATGEAKIDVKKGELTMQVEEEKVTFNVFNSGIHPEKSKRPKSWNKIEELNNVTKLR
ncbi:uncharacterized protein [Henckelia pumila]|uniref:uncharacterized protein n=1 Tax=Henckelia pumila TaxID=405737 RepID=UPI003C6E5CDD